ncbi:acyl-CoA thioester hydrolase/BAAT C-terminal domain-containing protein [Streptomyces sp. NPDC047987]|uniref:acyl-CoA thioester hydrolase/BAAT C-terminal domain-containing protein n=1 Tax=unclassified Streptomyces TaxID=2593676 RepID=UPI00343F1DE3
MLRARARGRPPPKPLRCRPTSPADLLLVAGGDDAMWPSLPYAEELADRRRAAGLPVRLISALDAGHRPRFPGEGPAPDSAHFLYGGSPAADAALGARAWPHLLDVFRGARGHRGGLRPLPARRMPAGDGRVPRP